MLVTTYLELVVNAFSTAKGFTDTLTKTRGTTQRLLMLRGHCVIQGKTHLYPQLLDHSFVGGDLLPQDRNLLVLNCDLFL